MYCYSKKSREILISLPRFDLVTLTFHVKLIFKAFLIAGIWYLMQISVKKYARVSYVSPYGLCISCSQPAYFCICEVIFL